MINQEKKLGRVLSRCVGHIRGVKKRHLLDDTSAEI